MLHQDGLRHVWLDGLPPIDLIIAMDDTNLPILAA